MSNTKTVMSQAANTQGIPLDITDVFSTYLYDGTNVAQTITNGIDLAGEGGLVWQKLRAHPTPPDGQDHYLRDTERGVGKRLRSNSTAAELNDGGITSVNSDGFALSSGTAGNLNGATYASWTFRKAPKFFDVVTYTGNGSSNRQIAHNLGSTPGFILIKRTDSTGNWLAWHKEVNPGYGISDLTLAFTAGANGFFNAVADTYFETSWLNTSGGTFVAYLFAHNDSGDGEFGPDGDQDIIKCGSYTGNGSADGPEINLGFEAQWVMLKRTDSTADWVMQDVMRGMIMDSGGAYIKANEPQAEFATTGYIQPEPTGFKVRGTGSGQANASGGNYIYMAIRRGPLAPPTAGTEVFKVSASSGSPYNPTFDAPFSVDMAIQLRTQGGVSSYARNGSRLTGTDYLVTSSTAVAGTTSNMSWDYNEGFFLGGPSGTAYAPMWKRAPSFFDAVAYTGTGSGHTSPKHNLSVAPEMIWVKRRNNTDNWRVLNPNNRMDVLNQAGTEAAVSTSAYYFGDDVNVVPPTSTEFTVHGPINLAESYIAYLFATLAGVSKVGSVTHSGTTNVDCGFSAGSRFVLLKRTDAPGGWYVWDSLRGIIAGNDPYLLLNTTAAQVTNTDYIDPLNAGFTISDNFTDGDYIFYAIA